MSGRWVPIPKEEQVKAPWIDGRRPWVVTARWEEGRAA